MTTSFNAPSPSDEVRHIDGCLIIGAGLAGLYLALKLAPRRCLVIAPYGPGQGAASAWAQGGIATAIAAGDSPDAHARDTIAVGGGLVDPLVAKAICAGGPDLVDDLARLGAPFDRTPGGTFALSREAAHSASRVVRVQGDGAGKAIMKAVAQNAVAAEHITLEAGLTATCLTQSPDGTVTGCITQTATNQSITITADAVILAAGGIGALYAVTTNPAQADGSSIALAARAGARIADAEFVQFHPTALDIGVDPAPLATEALRGEGAIVVDANTHPLTNPLGPRDSVARAVHEARQAGKGAFLDARSAIGAEFPDRFPAVFQAAMSAKLDPRTTPLPIAPAAHYHMGGVVTDLDGRTDVPGLYAVGEAARTGMHGANRLASNSLLEAGVIAGRTADLLRNTPAPPRRGQQNRPSPPPRMTEHQKVQLRAAMAAHASVTRNAEGLAQLNTMLATFTTDGDVPNPVLAAMMITTAAAARTHNCGAHWRDDAPIPSPQHPSPSTSLTWRGPDHIDQSLLHHTTTPKTTNG